MPKPLEFIHSKRYSAPKKLHTKLEIIQIEIPLYVYVLGLSAFSFSAGTVETMFSRLIVKGLPGNCTEAKLRSVFDSYGNITDCSLKYTKDGKFRRFAYVGFSEEGSASKALKHLDNTHIGSSKIKVLLKLHCFLSILKGLNASGN